MQVYAYIKPISYLYIGYYTDTDTYTQLYQTDTDKFQNVYQTDTDMISCQPIPIPIIGIGICYIGIADIGRTLMTCIYLQPFQPLCTFEEILNPRNSVKVYEHFPCLIRGT